jgi:hypothetical protein
MSWNIQSFILWPWYRGLLAFGQNGPHPTLIIMHTWGCFWGHSAWVLGETSSKSNGPNSIWQGALTLSDTITENCPFKERPTIITFMHKSQPCAWIPIEGKTSSLNGARGPILSPQCHSPIHLLYLNPKESRAQCTSRMHKTFATSLSPKVIRKEEFHFSQHLDYSKRELSLRLSRPVTYL